MSITEQKILFRKVMRQKRQSLCPRYCAQASQTIARLASPYLQRHKRIGVYWAQGSELDLFELINLALSKKAYVYLPHIPTHGRRLWFNPLNSKGYWYKGNRFSTWEYYNQPSIRTERLNVLFLPLLAVDQAGFRMGQGGGFYDTSLAYLQVPRPLLIGVGYDCQKVESLPKDSWDKPLDGIITESGFQWFRSTTLSLAFESLNGAG